MVCGGCLNVCGGRDCARIRLHREAELLNLQPGLSTVFVAVVFFCLATLASINASISSQRGTLDFGWTCTLIHALCMPAGVMKGQVIPMSLAYSFVPTCLGTGLNADYCRLFPDP